MDKNYSYFNYFHFIVLLNLLSYGAKDKYVEMTSTEISKIINRSQQTASNILIDLERENLIERIKSNRRFKLKVTTKGFETIKNIYELLKYSLDNAENISLTFKGKIVTGMGEGAYYMSLDGYKKQFQDKLGYVPFPGTLNIELEERYINSRRELIKYPSILIEGFRNSSRSFGWVKCYPVKIEIIDKAKKNYENSSYNTQLNHAHVLLLERTHHDNNLIEVIAPYSIKDAAKLQNGDKIIIKMVQQS